MSEQIVVGVDGSQAAENALIWAADTASRRGAHLAIVHCGAGARAEATSAGSVDYHHQVLREAVATAIEVSGTCNVSTVLRVEHPSQVLLELSETADMLVLGSRGVGAIAGNLLGSVAHRVASHGRCPVVIVPQNWRAPSAERGRPVSVGVSASPPGRDAVEFAFAEAESRGVPLIAVRAWAEFDWVAPVANFMTAGHDGVRYREQEQLTRLVDDAWRRHPSVEVDTELSSETRYDALLGAARRSDLLVMGCRNDEHLLSRLGAVGSRLLHSSPCPVVIVGQPAVVSGDGESAGSAIAAATSSVVEGELP
jgi:nucleotide-binding universal stress UspA family protein